MEDRGGKRYEAHLFICTNRREKGECCAARGSEELRARVKKLAKERGWKGRVRVNASGCLDRCSEGITAVLYPEGRWFTHLKPGGSEAPGGRSEDELLQAIEETLSKGEKKC